MLSAPHQFGLVYNSPACRDHSRRVEIGVIVAAGCAAEHVTPAPAALPALVASLAGVARIDVFNLDSSAFRLVSHEALQLAEAPPAHHAVEVATPDARALTNAFQPFEPDYSIALPFGFVNDRFAPLPPEDGSLLAQTL